MIYQNTDELLNILKKYNLWTKKSLGQNFLVNSQVLKKIVDAADLKKDDEILEVGPGLGVLSVELASRVKKVTAIELDQRVLPILRENLEPYKNVEVIHGDALKIPPPAYHYKLVANIPYYITSPLLRHYLELPEKSEKTFQRPSHIVLLIQKEVAEKICAKEGDHTILSLQVQLFGKPSIVSTVSKSSFFPQPKVDSAILKIETYTEPLISNITIFFKLIKAAFAQKRKTLLNSLQNRFQVSKETIIHALKQAEIDPSERPQMLSISQWEKLGNAFSILIFRNSEDS